MILVAQNIGATSFAPGLDQHNDGAVNVFDMIVVAQHIGTDYTGSNPPTNSSPTCTPTIPSTEVCDNVDNDCDTYVDEDHPISTTCGIGACASTGSINCVSGVEQPDSCIPGTAGIETNNCNDNVDNDCDGPRDCSDSDCSADPACIGGASPWLEEDWDYSSTTQMLSQPHLERYEYSGQIELITDSTAPWPSKKAFTVVNSGGMDIWFCWDGCSQSNLSPWPGPQTSREIWQETYIKFDSHWKTDFGGSGNPDHKTFFFFGPNSVPRWELKFGVYGGSLVCFSSDEGIPPTTNNPNHDTEVWDGEWHQVRVHIDMGSGGSTSAYEMWFDGVKRCGSTSLPTYLPSSYYWEKISLGRNLNQQATPDQKVWYGKTSVWTQDPGW
ncbi:hypothetical protein ACFL1B_04310 [Nanoarchaeota archaeon]